jgi:hypothetical protein
MPLLGQEMREVLAGLAAHHLKGAAREKSGYSDFSAEQGGRGGRTFPAMDPLTLGAGREGAALEALAFFADFAAELPIKTRPVSLSPVRPI